MSSSGKCAWRWSRRFVMADRGELSQPSRLPWARDLAESGRFGLITGLMLALCLIPALITPGMQAPEPEREPAGHLPARLAKRVQPPKPVEPPEPVVEPEPDQHKPEPEPEPEPEPKQVEEPQQIPP